MRRLLCAGALAAGMAPVGALHAVEPGPYLGFGLGRTSFDFDVSRDFDVSNDVSGSVDTTDTGYKIFGGYRFTPNVGVEVYFADLGDTTFRGDVSGAPDVLCIGDISGDINIDGFGVSMIGLLPAGRDFNVYGKFGIYSWDLNMRVTDSCGPFRETRSDTELMYGLGVSYQFNFQTSVQLEWERYTEILTDLDNDFISLGLSFALY